MRTNFEQPGTYPRLGPLGRAVRILLGALVLYFLVWSLLRHWRGWVELREGWETPRGTWYIGVLLMLYFLPGTLDRLFTVKWGWRSLAGWGALAVALAAFGLAFYGALWAPPLSWFLLLSIVFVFGALGLAFLVQAAAATPG